MPSLHLGFEYQVAPRDCCPTENLLFFLQDKHHYVSSLVFSVTLQAAKERDDLKKELMRAKGITLITVPCWWDGKRNRYCHLSLSPALKNHSLLATLRRDAPNVTVNHPPEDGEAIPEEIPARFLEKHVPHVEDIGEPTIATFMTSTSVDPTGWY